MNFLSRLFNTHKITCPRCLGKGHVNDEDIQRLNKEAYWQAGQCAYCNGRGKVSSNQTAKINADIGYLTTDLPAKERKRLLKGDQSALERAKEYDGIIEMLASDIEHFYYIENQDPPQIADSLAKKYRSSDLNKSETERKETIEYIEKVIGSKRSGR